MKTFNIKNHDFTPVAFGNVERLNYNHCQKQKHLASDLYLKNRRVSLTMNISNSVDFFYISTVRIFNSFIYFHPGWVEPKKNPNPNPNL